MRFPAAAFSALGLLLSVCSEKEEKAVGSVEARMVQYLAGVEVLGRIDASEEEKARHYARLKQLTGVTSEQAQAFLDKHRADPERWKAIHERITKQLNSETPPARKENSNGE